MQITLKCFAFLGQYLPPGTRGNTLQIEVVQGLSIVELLDQLNIDHDMVELAILNDQFIDTLQREQTILQPGDTLALWPEVAGG